MSLPRVHTLVRDHPGLNPFLRHLDIPPHAPVYWHPNGHLHRYAENGEAQHIPITTSTLLNWIVRHDPDELWSFWRHHLRGQRVLIEHTSINPVHPLHLGSMRGTVIGSGLARLFRSGGAQVQTRYFVNDLGRQLHILQRAAGTARWDNAPTDLRYDEIVGVLYAFANMTLGRRAGDLARLGAEHPWLGKVVDLHRPLPAAASIPELVRAMVAAAVTDMNHIGTRIDVFDYETDLATQPDAVLALAEQGDLVRVNGTTCLRLPGGLVPVQRRDGSLLYFSRDIANTIRRRPETWTAMLHVIGSDQNLLQTALHHAVPHACLEHISFGQVTRAGRRYSARQNRLTTIPDLLREGGPQRVHEYSLALALHRRTRPIDIAHLDTARPLRTVLAASHAGGRVGVDRGAHPDLLRRLMITLLGTPSVLARDIDRRTVHGTARHLLLLSRHYTAATHTGPVPDELGEWFRRTHTRLLDLLGVPPHATESSSSTTEFTKVSA
ncbi:arginine--tRNA ligase [Nocardia sp. NEAU-G5]|uniref:Arginine--tRNA ligase n=1 Tax=Nocardia albiluteola TaxID=2842303 RepID=A0ABS6AYM6_9NOCA|nr:arginine--tRNA ligase [Nocardia albiluteola]MBU3063152.1 arginine--tRNA ligase [Nocardia albiluteola]